MQDILLQTLIHKVEEKTNWGKGSAWPNQYFQKLSEQVYDKTGILISVSTLKRLFGKVNTSEDYTPQQDTKDALSQFAGFSNWNDFSKYFETKITIDVKKQNKTWIYIAPIVIVILVIVVLYFQGIFESVSTVRPVLKSGQGFFPNTIFLHYKSKESDSIKVSIDKNKDILLPVSDSIFSQYFKLPCYSRFQVKANGKNVLDTNVLIKSKGWAHMLYPKTIPYDPLDILPGYVTTSDIYYSNRSFFNPSDVQKAGLDTNQLYWTEHRLVTDSLANGENFTANLIWKNSKNIPTVLCNHAVLQLTGTKGNIKLHFAKPGCSKFIRLEFSEKQLEGGKNDLSMFEIFFADYQAILLQSRNKKISILLDGKPLFSTDYQQEIGTVKGIYIVFSGPGDVKSLLLNGKEIFN